MVFSLFKKGLKNRGLLIRTDEDVQEDVYPVDSGGFEMLPADDRLPAPGLTRETYQSCYIRNEVKVSKSLVSLCQCPDSAQFDV